MESVHLQIVKALAAAAAAASVTVDGVEFTKPAGLVVGRAEAAPIARGSVKRLTVRMADDSESGMCERVKPSSMGGRVEAQLFVAFIATASLPAADSPSEDAVDPLLVWSDAVVAANQELGGLALYIVPVGAGWAEEAGNPPLARAVRVYSVTLAYRFGNLTVANP